MFEKVSRPLKCHSNVFGSHTFRALSNGDISDDNKKKSDGSDILKILFIYFKTVKQIDGSRNE